jgi:hypothetical protein
MGKEGSKRLMGIVYAVYILDPARFWAVGEWNGDEWINYGTLNAGLALRVAFMLGVGRN